jgi:hypothetical protein
MIGFYGGGVGAVQKIVLLGGHGEIQFFAQKITFVNCGRGSMALPVNIG